VRRAQPQAQAQAPLHRSLHGRSNALHPNHQRVLGTGEIEQPRPDDTAAPPDLGNLRQIKRIGLIGRSGIIGLGRARMLQHVEPLGVGGHDSVLNGVVDHLDEVAGAVRAAMEVAALG
jgi:hypothetical protein